MKNPPLLLPSTSVGLGRTDRTLSRFPRSPAPLEVPEPFAAQLALARVHPQLVPMRSTSLGYEADSASSAWVELAPQRGLAGYGLSRALRMLVDVLTGLGALHETVTPQGKPFVHGELVPELLRVDGSGVTRLMPLAPWHWSAPGRLASVQRWGHLAPERLLGDAMDQRADVFSVGVLLWEALAGRRLFEHGSVDAVITRLMGGKVKLPELPAELNWALPLKDLAMRALSVDPARRFADSAQFKDAILDAAKEWIATPAEVSAHWSAGHHALFAPRPSVPTHKSSLSALVAPIEPAAPPSARRGTPSEQSEPIAQLAPVEPQRAQPIRVRVRQSMWAAAVVLCVSAALLIHAAARYHTELIAARAAAARVSPVSATPAFAVPAERSVPSASALPSVSAAPPPSPAVSVSRPSKPKSKAPRVFRARPAPALPVLKEPARPVQTPDQGGGQYGI